MQDWRNFNSLSRCLKHTSLCPTFARFASIKNHDDRVFTDGRPCFAKKCLIDNGIMLPYWALFKSNESHDALEEKRDIEGVSQQWQD